MKKIKVLVSGCNGQMGQIVCRLIEESEDMKVVAGIDSDTMNNNNYTFPIFPNTQHIPPDYDVIIDFSNPTFTEELLCEAAYFRNTPTVIGTTGHTPEELDSIGNWALDMPIFLASNMSYSVALLEQVVREIAPKLPSYDIEIVETHHNRKKDAPSGTAKTLATAIAESLSATGKDMNIVYGREAKRESNEIGIASLRGGNIVGTHTINFYGPSDTFSITHTALSREMFAEGALKAARFMVEREKKGGFSKGLFTMKDMM